MSTTTGQHASDETPDSTPLDLALVAEVERLRAGREIEQAMIRNAVEQIGALGDEVGRLMRLTRQISVLCNEIYGAADASDFLVDEIRREFQATETEPTRLLNAALSEPISGVVIHTGDRDDRLRAWNEGYAEALAQVSDDLYEHCDPDDDADTAAILRDYAETLKSWMPEKPATPAAFTGSERADEVGA